MSLGFLDQINSFIQSCASYLMPWAETIGVIWCINIFNWILGSPLNRLGIYPRKLSGLIGIIFSPILHRNFTHLLFNTIPLFILGLALLTFNGAVSFYWITFVIVILSGLAVWCVARKGLHIGASSLISGYFGYILISAYKDPSLITVMLAVLAVYYFGGIFMGIFPGKKDISWEGHLFGLLSGVAAAYIPNLFLNFIK